MRLAQQDEPILKAKTAVKEDEDVPGITRQPGALIGDPSRSSKKPAVLALLVRFCPLPEPAPNWGLDPGF